MATRIPLPGNERGGLFEGLMAGHKRQDEQQRLAQHQQQMQQQWQEHLRNAAIREQQEERLRALQPYIMAQYENKSEQQPLQMEALRARIESLRANAEKARNPTSQKETPEEKRAARMQEFKEKEEYKRQNKESEDYTKPTKTLITQQQNIVAAGNNLRKQLRKLQQTKSPNMIGYITPGDRAKYKTEVGKAADTLLATYKWLGIEASLDMAKQMTTRELGETDAEYSARLKGLEEEAAERIANAEEILKTNKVQSHKFDSSSKNTPNLEETPTKIVNGQEYDVHSSETNNSASPAKRTRKRWNPKTQKMETV